MSSSDAKPVVNLDEVHFLEHPLIVSKMTLLRSAKTSPADFRRLVRELSLLVGAEASRDLPLQAVEEVSPLSKFEGYRIAGEIALVPIMRAGIGMVEPLLELLPTASVYHLGLYRDKATLLPTEYYSRLPSKGMSQYSTVYILDVMVATGGTAVAAINMVLDSGVPIERIKFVCLNASMAGIQHILASHPTLQLWVGSADSELTPEGYILPGLGDAGDRLNNNI